MSNNLNEKINNEKDTTMNKIKSIISNLNNIRKEVYGLYPNISINDIAKIISCINLTETNINKSNVNRVKNNENEKNQQNQQKSSNKVSVKKFNGKEELDDEILKMLIAGFNMT